MILLFFFISEHSKGTSKSTEDKFAKITFPFMKKVTYF